MTLPPQAEPHAPPLPQTTSAKIVPTKLVLAIYVREQAGRLTVTVDDKTDTYAEFQRAGDAAVKALEQRWKELDAVDEVA